MKRGLLFTLSIWLVGATMIRGTLLMPHRCPVVTGSSALAAARESAAWIERAQGPDGTYVYEYDRGGDFEPGGYNIVRHAGVTMSLYQLANGDPSTLPAADRGMAYMIDNLYSYQDWAAFQNPDDGGIQLGASALMLAGLMQRRIATDDAKYDELSRRVARGLLALQLEDGGFLNRWDTRKNAPVPDERSKYATGEAFWALTLMHRFFPAEGWDVFALKTADYLALSRDDYEDQKFPPWADQWAAYGLGEMAAWPQLAEHHITYARSLAERFGFLIRVESQRRANWFSKALHGRQARAAGMGTWVEGLTALYRLASADPRMVDMKAKLAERIECGAGMLAARQVSPSDASGGANETRTRGAWFTNDVTRMDDQQHALSGLLYAAPIVASRENQ